MKAAGIVLLTLGGFFGVVTLLAPAAAGERNNPATLLGGLVLTGIFIGLGLLLLR